MDKIKVSENLTGKQCVYRYLSLSSFLYLVETEQFVFSRTISWEDNWELPLAKTKRLGVDGEQLSGAKEGQKDFFGQCWTENYDSDAMWRIYSPDKQGIMISTTVEKLKSISGIGRGVIGKVLYYSSLENAIKDIKESHEKIGYATGFYGAFMKRNAFKHEEEIRIVFNGRDKLVKNISKEDNYYSSHIDLKAIIDAIVIDPRADEYFVDTIKKYCERKGMQCKVTKSELYKDDIQEKGNVVMKYELVES
jgi:cellobiose-specific phosphotransferase system component IIB